MTVGWEMTQKPFTVADYLLTRLKQLNVTEIFQIPGDYVKNFTQALEHFDGVNTIGAINELDAAYAADAYGRTRGWAPYRCNTASAPSVRSTRLRGLTSNAVRWW
jgi:thiamine pyrophosphate-dependent acetolactate synthase large subunit-like protein